MRDSKAQGPLGVRPDSSQGPSTPALYAAALQLCSCTNPSVRTNQIAYRAHSSHIQLPGQHGGLAPPSPGTPRKCHLVQRQAPFFDKIQVCMTPCRHLLIKTAAECPQAKPVPAAAKDSRQTYRAPRPARSPGAPAPTQGAGRPILTPDRLAVLVPAADLRGARLKTCPAAAQPQPGAAAASWPRDRQTPLRRW